MRKLELQNFPHRSRWGNDAWIILSSDPLVLAQSASLNQYCSKLSHVPLLTWETVKSIQIQGSPFWGVFLRWCFQLKIKKKKKKLTHPLHRGVIAILNHPWPGGPINTHRFTSIIQSVSCILSRCVSRQRNPNNHSRGSSLTGSHGDWTHFSTQQKGGLSVLHHAGLY